jgi:hypothetical protein
MKRALTAAVFGGLFAILVPNVALGGTTRPVAPYDHNAEHKDGDCAGQTEGAADSEQAPAPRAGDNEQHGSDGGETLF